MTCPRIACAMVSGVCFAPSSPGRECSPVFSLVAFLANDFDSSLSHHRPCTCRSTTVWSPSHQCGPSTKRLYVEHKLRDGANNPTQSVSLRWLCRFSTHPPFTSSHNEVNDMSSWKGSSSGKSTKLHQVHGGHVSFADSALSQGTVPMSSRNFSSCKCHIVLSRSFIFFHSRINVLDGCVCCSFSEFNFNLQ